MAPTKKKAAPTMTNTATAEAETSNLQTVPILAAAAPEQTAAQTTRASTQVQGQPPAQEKNKAALTNQDIEFVEDEEAQHKQEDEYSQTALKLKALEREKANLTAQLATQQQAITQAKKLAEAKRKLARMQSEVEQLQKACEAHDASQIEASRQPQVYNLRHEPNPHQ